MCGPPKESQDELPATGQAGDDAPVELVGGWRERLQRGELERVGALERFGPDRRFEALGERLHLRCFRHPPRYDALSIGPFSRLPTCAETSLGRSSPPSCWSCPCPRAPWCRSRTGGSSSRCPAAPCTPATAAREGHVVEERVRGGGQGVQADPVHLRADPREARPEGRPRQTGHDREAGVRRLHHPLQARPRLVDDGSKPQTHNMHLHHATWLNARQLLRRRPVLRRRRGEDDRGRSRPATAWRSKARTTGCCSTWCTTRCRAAEQVWITYDIDFVARGRGDAIGITPVKPIWLDVQKRRDRATARRARARTRCSTFSAASAHATRRPAAGLRLAEEELLAPRRVRQRARRSRASRSKLAGQDWTCRRSWPARSSVSAGTCIPAACATR